MQLAACRQTPSAIQGPDSLDAVEREITTLAAHLNAATYRFLTLIADFDRRAGWDGFGIRSCAHWLNWKCGIGVVAGREKLRVAHALEHLPQISDAMERGTLSYAKVRAMTRVATPENEEFLLTIAQNGTATHLERVVQHYRRTQRLEELVQENARHAARSLRYYWDEDGCLVIDGRLPPEQGVLLVKALEAADLALREADQGPQQRAKGTARERRPAEASKAEDLSAQADVRADSATPNDAGRSVQPVLERSAEVVVDASAEASWRTAGPAEHAPSANATWANRRADALALLAETFLARGPAALRGGDRHLVHVHVDLTALHNPNGEGESAIEGGPAVPAETVRRLCCDGSLVTCLEEAGRTLDVGRKTRTIAPALRRALERRDGGCQFPGCTNHRFVDAHHIEHWVDGGATKLENLTLLCRYHHRLVHEGGFQLSRDGDTLRFGAPDGRPIPAVPPLPEAPHRAAETLSEEHARRGLLIDEQTAICDWGGERADYAYMMSVLWQLERASA